MDKQGVGYPRNGCYSPTEGTINMLLDEELCRVKKKSQKVIDYMY